MLSPNSIFISYRRSDSNEIVGRIYDRLQEHFGQDIVFKDVESIPYGDDFRTHLVRTVTHCQVLVAVIGPTWLDTLQERLARADQQDWVRAEIETALQRETAIPVIPLLVGGADMPSGNDLPKALQPLANRNATQARPDPDFHTDLDRLIRRLEEIIGTPELSAKAQSSRSLERPETNLPTVTEPIKQASQSQSIGNITISGNNNPFNAIQAGGDVNVNQSQSQNQVTNPSLQKALETVKVLKQSVTATNAMDDTEKAMVAIPIQKLEGELQSSQPDRQAIEKAIATINKMAAEAIAITKLTAKISALTVNI
ncbi:MAG: toll/interleukin-1 receptor domain-containing protein [Cyanobacteria bacterium J06638_20]